jgi:hypothetical protein
MVSRGSKGHRFQGWAGAGLAALFASIVTVPPGLADPPQQDWVRTETREDCTSYDALRKPLFGETHVHTKYSADAVLARTRNGPREAYDFAKGSTVGLPPYDALDVAGRTATIDRPLDFAAVTDHAEGFGEARICLNDGYDGYDDPLCANLRATFDNTYHPTNDLPLAFIQFFQALSEPNPQRFSGICGPGYADCTSEAGLVWQYTQAAAEEYYDRTSACEFTTFVAYEWSGNTGQNNLHRNVIFRNDQVPGLPISYYEEPTAEGLWEQLISQCLDAAGDCDVLAIPHNSNIARNAMFSQFTSNGQLWSAELAARRASLEPIMEIIQGKGDSECRDGVFGTTDELCSFEKLSRDTLLGTSNWNRTYSAQAYARGALKLGLLIEGRTGVNPFSLGFIGSTDSHNGTSGAVSEVDYGRIGFAGVADSEAAFILADGAPPSKIESNGGGLAVVWAEENSRDAIFAAMRRRETYSTSGTRPIVRSFAGRYPLDLCDDPDFVAEGYDKGVPMGGEIGPVRGKYSPRFAVLAHKDPGTMARPGTPLQRAQIIKGWLDPRTGETHELVYDVAGDPDNGAGVDPETCAETGTGASTLCTVWEDPDFDPKQKAFYYLRVVENPVCRWSQQLCSSLKTCSTHLTACSLDHTRTCTTNTDCSAFDTGSVCNVDYPVVCVNNADCGFQDAGTCGSTPAVDCSNPSTVPPGASECCDTQNPVSIQERAVASPIWYRPKNLGIAKGAVAFGDDAATDKMQLAMFFGEAPDELDPETNDIVLTLRDDAVAWTATIPAGTMEVKKPGSSFKYKDKTGAIAGITGFSIKITKGSAKLKLKTAATDLSTLTRATQTLSLDFEVGGYSSTAEHVWSFDDPKLSVTF